MTAGDNRTAGAGISDVIETIEAIAARVLLRVFGAQQNAFAKALVDLDVELIVRRGIYAGAKPIAVLQAARIGGLIGWQGEKLNEFCGDGIDEITRAGGKVEG